MMFSFATLKSEGVKLLNADHNICFQMAYSNKIHISVSSTLLSAMIKSICLKARRWIVLLNILADLSLESLPPLLQLLDGTILRKLVRSTAHLALSQTA